MKLQAPTTVQSPGLVPGLQCIFGTVTLFRFVTTPAPGSIIGQITPLSGNPILLIQTQPTPFGGPSLASVSGQFATLCGTFVRREGQIVFDVRIVTPAAPPAPTPFPFDQRLLILLLLLLLTGQLGGGAGLGGLPGILGKGGLGKTGLGGLPGILGQGGLGKTGLGGLPGILGQGGLGKTGLGGLPGILGQGGLGTSVPGGIPSI